MEPVKGTAAAFQLAPQDLKLDLQGLEGSIQGARLVVFPAAYFKSMFNLYVCCRMFSLLEPSDRTNAVAWAIPLSRDHRVTVTVIASHAEQPSAGSFYVARKGKTVEMDALSQIGVHEFGRVALATCESLPRSLKQRARLTAGDYDFFSDQFSMVRASTAIVTVAQASDNSSLSFRPSGPDKRFMMDCAARFRDAVRKAKRRVGLLIVCSRPRTCEDDFCETSTALWLSDGTFRLLGLLSCEAQGRFNVDVAVPSLSTFRLSCKGTSAYVKAWNQQGMERFRKNFTPLSSTRHCSTEFFDVLCTWPQPNPANEGRHTRALGSRRAKRFAQLSSSRPRPPSLSRGVPDISIKIKDESFTAGIIKGIEELVGRRHPAADPPASTGVEPRALTVHLMDGRTLRLSKVRSQAWEILGCIQESVIECGHD